MNPSLRGITSTRDHRGYNSFNNTLVFRGDTLDLGQVLKALEEILGTSKPYAFIN
jgi:hypothetical protein